MKKRLTFNFKFSTLNSQLSTFSYLCPMRLLFFNPENDLALASGDSHYTPPASARQMAQDLQRLPLLWAQPDDLILLRDGTVVDDCGHLTFNFQLSTINYKLLPWGWSPLLVRQLSELGVPASLLPTEKQMKAYRQASSRERGVRLLSALRQRLASEPLIIGESAWCTTEEDIWEHHRRYGSSMLKAPWSGSGRGVHPVSGTPTDKDVAWVRRVIARQGGVEIEPIYYNKVQDLALELWCEGGQVRDEGLSLFTTTAGGVYSGNLVASEDEKLRLLSAYIPLELLAEVRRQIVDLLNDALRDGSLPSWYTGPLGIDMMITANRQLLTGNFQYSLHPFIELNLRMTMGWVALQLGRDLRPNEKRLFRIIQERGRYHWENR